MYTVLYDYYTYRQQWVQRVVTELKILSRKDKCMLGKHIKDDTDSE